MELMPGYKRTEVGVIPEEWRVEPMATLTTGVSSGKSKPMKGATTFPVFGSTGIIGHTEKPAHEGKAILVARVGANAGTLNVVTGQYGVTDNTIIVSTSERVLPDFLWRVLQTKRLNSLVFGSGQPLITGTQLKALPIQLPSVDEQRAIATALSDVDALLSQLDHLIAKKRDIKQAAMQQLLTGKTRLPGFAGAWETRRLCDLGEFMKGSGISRDQSSSGTIPCVRYGEIYTAHDNVVRHYRSFISPAVAAMALRLRAGDLLFAGSGETKEEIGKCVAFVDEIEAYAGGDIVVLRPRSIDTTFLGYALNVPQVVKQKASRGQGDAVVHISASALADVSLSMPGKAEQTAIANILTDIDAELATLEARRDKTRALKQGMMQALLTGRTRLI